MKRKLSGFESLEKELKREISFIRYDTVATKDHTYFLDQSAKLFAHLLSNKKTLQSNSTQIITHLMDTLPLKADSDYWVVLFLDTCFMSLLARGVIHLDRAVVYWHYAVYIHYQSHDDRMTTKWLRQYWKMTGVWSSITSPAVKWLHQYCKMTVLW